MRSRVSRPAGPVPLAVVSDSGDASAPDPELAVFRDRMAEVGSATLEGLQAFEAASRHLHPPVLPSLREKLSPLRDRLAAAIPPLLEFPPPVGGEALRDGLVTGAEYALAALHGFCDEGEPEAGGMPKLLEGMRSACRAQESLYSMRFALPPLGRLYAEQSWHDRLAELDPDPPEGMSVGLHAGGGGRDREQRGGFVFYVPETARPDRPMPLVVALHGGFGHGADFLWTWFREARTRGFLLLAPTSRSTTWSLNAPAADGRAVDSMVSFLAERFPVDPTHVLLTGLSDGATFSLLLGLGEEVPYTHLAPLSGVLHPINFEAGNLARAKSKPIHLVHGALDWMFPVDLARMARDELEKAGADLVYHEIENLSHTYAREENARILRWFDPRLGLPGEDAEAP